MMLKSYISLLVSFTFIGDSSSYPTYKNLIPNGNKVTNPCDGTAWEGVGHMNKHGGGARNPFGSDFDMEGKTWTKALCQKDSDGDGKTNGDELGDPMCVWTPGQIFSMGQNITHPGICEPIGAPFCRNSTLKCEVEPWCPSINKPDVRTLNITLPKHSRVPSQETTYICYNKKVPSDQLYDIIASRAIIDNNEVMHHMTMYGCDGELESNLDGTVDKCELRNKHCEKMLFIWAIGMEALCQPDYKAFRFGKGLTTWVSIQFHWNNQMRRSDMSDSSGLQMFYTPKLRPYAEDIFQTGDAAIFIPPHSKEHKVTGLCSENCSKRNFEHAFNISGIVLHMHATGKRIWAKHYRNGKLLRQIAEDNPFTYSRPVLHRFDNNPIEFLPGDELKMECTFNTEDRADWTMHGPGYRDEMCVTLVLYYPANLFKVQNCFSINGKCASNLKESLPGCNINILVNHVKKWRTRILRYCDEQFGRICSNTCRSIVDNIKDHNPGCFYNQPVDVSRSVWGVLLRNLLDVDGDRVMKSFRGCELYSPAEKQDN